MKFVTATTVSTNAGAISNSTTLVLPTTAAPAIADDMRVPVMNLIASKDSCSSYCQSEVAAYAQRLGYYLHGFHFRVGSEALLGSSWGHSGHLGVLC